ncbi:hypothetical protein FJ420_31110 [Mesorhizobium sp. B3-1-3]|nr:hypothetical protein FJ420_31110 [Mesorhizobium sp. B3-1-3]
MVDPSKWTQTGATKRAADPNPATLANDSLNEIPMLECIGQTHLKADSCIPIAVAWAVLGFLSKLAKGVNVG